MAGEIIIGGYRLVNLMMTGQTSQVWEVIEDGTHRSFALKLLLPEKLREAEHRQFLKHEAKVGMTLSHPNIIRVFKYVADRQHPHFVMELFRAPNLRMQILQDHASVLRRAPRIVEQAALALAYLHDKGWVHRDIKPDNLLVNKAAELRLIDFALCRRIQGKWATLLGKNPVQGTRSYMSPEAIRGKPLDRTSDVYSFGITLYEIGTGRTPFRGATPDDLLTKHLRAKPVPPSFYNDNLTREFDELVLRMLAKKKENRPPDMNALLAEWRKIRMFKRSPEEASETPAVEGAR